MSCKQTGNNVVVSAAPVAEAFDFEGMTLTDYGTSGDTDDAAVIGCVFAATPPGIEYDIVEDDQCLTDAEPAVELGDEQTSEFTITTAYCPGGTASSNLETWAKNGQRLIIEFAYPANGEAAFGVNRYCAAKIRVWQPDSIEKKVFMKVNLTLIRTSIIRELVLTS